MTATVLIPFSVVIALIVVPVYGAMPTTSTTTSSVVATTQPTLGFDSPLAAMRSFVIAQYDGLPDVLGKAIYADGPAAQRYTAALVEMAAAVQAVRNAVISAIGNSEASKIRAPFGPEEGVDPITGATASVDGNSAVVHRNEASIPFLLVHGQWKLDIARVKFIQQYPGFVLRWNRVAAAWRLVAEDVRAGKYKESGKIIEAMKTAELKAIDETDREYLLVRQRKEQKKGHYLITRTDDREFNLQAQHRAENLDGDGQTGGGAVTTA